MLLIYWNYYKWLCCIYIMIIITVSKPSQVSTGRYLPITVSSTIDKGFIWPHTYCDKTCVVCREVVGLTARRRLLVLDRVNIQQCWGSSQVAPFFLGCAEQTLRRHRSLWIRYVWIQLRPCCVDTYRSSTGLCSVDTFRNSKSSSRNTVMWGSNGKVIEAKLSKSYDNEVFFHIDAKQTCLIV